MTITVVRLDGKPVQNTLPSGSESPATPAPSAQSAQQTAAALGNDAVRISLSTRSATERAEPITTYGKARKTTDEVAGKIRENEGNHAANAHHIDAMTARRAEA
jgi:hypothetical protein